MTRACIRNYPRSMDDDALAMVQMRAEGRTPSAIAAKFGVERQDVNRITTNILKADEAESGEPRAKVRRFYW